MIMAAHIFHITHGASKVRTRTSFNDIHSTSVKLNTENGLKENTKSVLTTVIHRRWPRELDGIFSLPHF
jgi:hypothetical protein